VKPAPALVALLVLAGCGGDSVPEDEPDLSEPAAMTLRLSDLPEGFRYADDRGCGEVETTEGDEPELDEFLIESRPRACLGAFSREWGGPPRSVQSALFLFDSDEDAKRAWELRKALFEAFARIRLTTERPGGAFDSEGLQQLGAGEAWRDDRLVVAVYEEGLSGEAGRRFAADLAEKQRQRIESPSSPEPEDDREIELEDPAIGIPVYWLGREFEPDGLPALELEHGDVSEGGPGNEARIDYGGGGSGVTLDLWRPETWERFEKPCGRRSELSVRDGRAEIYGCAGGWLAHVYHPEVVISATATGAYDSRDGMEAVVRGLRRR
jgi:hypothetical protein